MKKFWAVLFLGYFVLVGLIGPAKADGISSDQSQIADEFIFQGIIDIKEVNMINAAFTETSDWMFYPVCRAILSKGFTKKKFMLFADIERPGYTSITYPGIKVNEMYAKLQDSSYYVKIGRQQIGNSEDLLLGFQNDAIAVGLSSMSFDMTAFFDVMLFYAKTSLATPWTTGGTIDDLAGIISKFDIGPAMKLDAKLLIGREAITIISGATSEDTMNTLIQAGSRFDLAILAGAGGAVDIAAQLGAQMGLARTVTDNTIDANAVAVKLDAMYSLNNRAVDLKIGGHFIYTGGDPDPSVNTKAGFASLNSLAGAGPGFFSEMESGAGLYSFVDTHLVSDIIHRLEGLMAAGMTMEFEINQFVSSLGCWYFSDTNDDGLALGMEIDQSLVYRLSKALAFYEQFAYFLPEREGLEQRGLWTPNPPAPLPATSDPEPAMKVVVGTSISF